jgi:ligand-binding sensor domain-containing protein
VGPTYIDIRINGTAFDKSGNLWVTKPNKKWIKSFENQRSMAKLCHGWNFKSPNDNNFGTIAIDKMEQNGFQPIATAWLVLMKVPILKKITAGSDTGNLPSSNVRTVAIDTRNQLWIAQPKDCGRPMKRRTKNGNKRHNFVTVAITG